MHLAGRVLETPVVAYSVLIDTVNVLVILQSINRFIGTGSSIKDVTDL
jgi:hypothetical protein